MAAAQGNSDDNTTRLVSPEGIVEGGDDGGSATITITKEISTSNTIQKLDQQPTASPVSISPVRSPRILTNRRRDLYAQVARRGCDVRGGRVSRVAWEGSDAGVKGGLGGVLEFFCLPSRGSRGDLFCLPAKKDDVGGVQD